MIRQHDVRWDEIRKVWYCARCGRVSNYASKADAVMELGEYLCEPKISPK